MEADASFLSEPQEEAVARGRKRPYSELVSTGRSFWLFWESILPCRKLVFPYLLKKISLMKLFFCELYIHHTSVTYRLIQFSCWC
jgi:hypothetical protein